MVNQKAKYLKMDLEAFKDQSYFQMTLEIFLRNLIREIDNFIKCRVFMSSINQALQQRNRFMTGLETLHLKLLSRAGKNQMNLVLGFLKKKNEQEDLIRIPFVRKEVMTKDSVIHPHNSGGTSRGRCRRGQK